ncbi:hypothetical protein Droror1_Dr00022533 [Drosera rotundifolia]
MVLPWRRRKTRRSASGKRTTNENSIELEPMIPSNFICPISLDLMKDPVTISSGITYDRYSIETWLAAGNVTCPTTNQNLTSLEPTPNHTIRKMIQNWCVENRAFGMERVSTPKTPLRESDVLDIVAKLVGSRDDEAKCSGMVVKIKRLAKESERNRECIAKNGASAALSSIFHHFASQVNRNPIPKMMLLGEILSIIASIHPSRPEIEQLGSVESLRIIVWLMTRGDLSHRRTAVLILKWLSASQDTMEVLMGIAEAEEGLVKLIKEPICAASTKSALVIINHMITADQTGARNAKGFIAKGLVSSTLELLVDAEKSTCEKGLRVLDEIFNYQEGRIAAFCHALTVPVLIKKILRVSELATEFSVSILWKLSKNEAQHGGRGGEEVVDEALGLGGFQKLLLVLQIGYFGDEGGKEKVTELLKLMNMRRGRMVECIDSMDFKNLKRPF